MKQLAIIAGAVALGACLPHPPPPEPPYRAVGKAPSGWTLIVDDKHVTFIGDGGQTPLRQPVPQAIIGVAGEIYRTERIEVNIVHRACADGRTGLSYPDSVQVYVDGRLHEGCGGL